MLLTLDFQVFCTGENAFAVTNKMASKICMLPLLPTTPGILPTTQEPFDRAAFASRVLVNILVFSRTSTCKMC